MVGERFFILAGIALLATGSAHAQLKPPIKDAPAKPPLRAQPLNQKQAQAELFGIDLRGFVNGDKTYRWRECINPDGNTVYYHDETEEKGLLRIDKNGMACFSYPPGNKMRESCFTAYREGKQFRFQGYGSTFTTTSAQRVKACVPDTRTSEAPIRPRVMASTLGGRDGG
jgi:hypothetical protein